MVIAMPQDEPAAQSARRIGKGVSEKRLAANRANARKSTGPRTAEGKARAARNACKHGLCSAYAALPEECEATFHTFVNELREELQPRTVVQRMLFPRIVNLMWRLQRLGDAQLHMFELERAKAQRRKGERVPPCEVLARRFSEQACNGFILLNRYERSMENALLRLMKQYHAEKKNRATAPWPEDEPPVPRERAWREPASDHALEPPPDQVDKPVMEGVYDNAAADGNPPAQNEPNQSQLYPSPHAENKELSTPARGAHYETNPPNLSPAAPFAAGDAPRPARGARRRFAGCAARRSGSFPGRV